MRTLTLMLALSLLVGGWVYTVVHRPTPPATNANVTQTKIDASRPKVVEANSRTDQSRTRSSSAQGTSSAPMQSARLAFKRAADYAEYALQVRRAAESGDPEAQFFLSEALRYCSVNAKAHFTRPTGESKSIANVQAHWATRPAGYQQEVQEAYDRCHTFIDDPTRKSDMADWESWLDRAVENKYPIAESTKATLLRNANLVAQFSQDNNTKADGAGLEESRGLALDALQSKEPEVLWQMADFVTARDPFSGEPDPLAAAWRLLACERGYDCSAQSEWMRAACSSGNLCNPGDTVQQYLENSFGHEFSTVQETAKSIGVALDTGQWSKMHTYLWDRP